MTERRWMSHPVRGAWIEIVVEAPIPNAPQMSHPVRGAWIEIITSASLPTANQVASRKGCVD